MFEIDNLIFSHRYRGYNKDDEFGLTLHKVEKILTEYEVSIGA